MLHMLQESGVRVSTDEAQKHNFQLVVFAEHTCDSNLEQVFLVPDVASFFHDFVKPGSCISWYIEKDDRVAAFKKHKGLWCLG